MGVHLSTAKKLLSLKKRSAGLSTLGANGITVQPVENEGNTKHPSSPKRDPQDTEDEFIVNSFENLTDRGEGEPALVNIGEEGGVQMNEELRLLLEMYDLLGTEIEQRQGRLVPQQQQQPQAKRASLEPRINQILNQQQEMYKLMVGRKSNSANAHTPQINELIQLAERFFKQMTKDNEEIRQLISKQTTTKTVRRESFVEALKRIKSVTSERRLSAAQNKILQLKTILENENIEDALIQDVLDSQAEIERMHLENEKLQDRCDDLESKSDNLEHELELLREQMKERDEQLEVLKTQMRLNEDQMRYDLEVKLGTIQEMEEEIVLLSEKLTERDDLHEIGHFMMSEMREQQLLETLEDTKAQLLETMDELEDVSDALHRESITNRELQQIIAIKDQKVTLLEMTMEDLRVAYDSNNSTSINVNIDFNNSKMQSSIDYDNFGSERSESQKSVEFGADMIFENSIIQEILKASKPPASAPYTPPAFCPPTNADERPSGGEIPHASADPVFIDFDDDEASLKQAAEKVMNEDQRKRNVENGDGEVVYE